LPGELEVVVINTGPVISLGRAGLLDLIGKLAIRFVMPSEVAEEITAGADAGHPVRVRKLNSTEAVERDVAFGGHLCSATESPGSRTVSPRWLTPGSLGVG
jgi:hypothetical protein